jgi:hypothetical protein
MKTAAPPAAIDPAEPLAETDSAERPVDAERPLAADDAQPAEPADDGANADDGDPELQALLDRALSVMNSELAADEDDEPTASEPEAAAELL